MAVKWIVRCKLRLIDSLPGCGYRQRHKRLAFCTANLQSGWLAWPGHHLFTAGDELCAVAQAYMCCHWTCTWIFARKLICKKLCSHSAEHYASDHSTVSWSIEYCFQMQASNPRSWSILPMFCCATTLHVQISETYQEPTIILMVWPPKQQLAGAQNGTKGINETVQYMQGMPSLYTQVSAATESHTSLSHCEQKHLHALLTVLLRHSKHPRRVVMCSMSMVWLSFLRRCESLPPPSSIAQLPLKPTIASKLLPAEISCCLPNLRPAWEELSCPHSHQFSMQPPTQLLNIGAKSPRVLAVCNEFASPLYKLAKHQFQISSDRVEDCLKCEYGRGWIFF